MAVKTQDGGQKLIKTFQNIPSHVATCMKFGCYLAQTSGNIIHSLDIE